MTVLVIYSCVITLGLLMLGRRYASHRAWSYVDAIYYPLGIAGVCFLFLSSLDTKEHAARQFDATFEAIGKEVELASNVSNAYLELFRFLGKPLRLELDCQDENMRTEFYATFCMPVGGGIGAFVAAVSQVKDKGPDVEYASACTGFVHNREHLTRRQSLKPLVGQLTDAEYHRAGELISVVAGACSKYLEVLARPREERIAENVLEQQHHAPGHRNTLFETLLFYAKEWLWPFVLVFALALKVGKSSAGLQHASRT
jgi:hypothetical protein